jgi:molecular chaperone GrpE
MDDTTPKPANESLTGNEDFGSDAVTNNDVTATAAAEDNTDFPDMNPEMFAQLEELQKKIARADDLEREVAEWKTKFSRLYADFESYRRRMGEEVIDAKTAGESKAVEAMLPMLDDVSRALDAGVSDPSTLIPGFSSVRENFLKTLSSFGVESVPGKGELFDPNVHEAIGTGPGDQDDMILEVYQAGFTIRGKLVRPARVLVSKQIN